MSFDPRLKIAAVALLGISLFLWPEIPSLSVILLASIGLGLLFGVKYRAQFTTLRHLFQLIVIVSLMQLLFIRTGEVLVSLGSFPLITTDGLDRAAFTALFYSSLLVGGLIMTTMTNSQAVRGLLQLGLPYRLAFMTMIAFDFIPFFREAFDDTVRAIQLRGVDIKSIPLRNRLRVYSYLLTPVVASALMKARYLALSMQTRGFGALPKRTMYRSSSFSARDWIVLALLLSLFLAFLSIKVLPRMAIS
ncbi:MAG: energy-coupling factor transporter transmembrane protein EcfT [Actinomycetia bacterium]|nr:energy-coupling factor transporter transmembrane protein EcfT [Actinomycetes bacterium]